jgi:phage shock protein A
MALFRRVGNIFSANLNELLESFEDPQLMMKQSVRDMEAALGANLDGAARVIAGEKLLGRQVADERRQAASFEERAQEAVRRGDDESARAALRQKRAHAELAAVLEEQQRAAQEASRRLRRQIELLRVRLAEARRQLAMLVARQQAAALRRRFAVDAYAIDDEPYRRFDRLAERVAQAEAESDAFLELIGGESVGVGEDEGIERELESLRARHSASREQSAL